MKNKLMYGDWIIECNQKPLFGRRLCWDAVHKDYDGDEDDRAINRDSIEELIEIIDEEYSDDN